MRIKKRDYTKEVRSNPNIYCFCDCWMEDCPKHKKNVDRSRNYLFAIMKDTPYCPYEDPEDYEREEWT